MEITINEYADKIGRSRASVYRKIIDGFLPARRLGRQWIIEEDTPYIDHRSEYGEMAGKVKRGTTTLRPKMEQRILENQQIDTAQYRYIFEKENRCIKRIPISEIGTDSENNSESWQVIKVYTSK